MIEFSIIVLVGLSKVQYSEKMLPLSRQYLQTLDMQTKKFLLL